MTHITSLLHVMVVSFIVNNRVAMVTAFEGELVIGRDEEDFDRKLNIVQEKMRKERMQVLWEKRRKLLEELKKDNISVELDSKDTRREIEGDPDDNKFVDITIPRRFFDKIPLPTVHSTETENPDFSRDLQKLYRSIDSIDAKMGKNGSCSDELEPPERGVVGEYEGFDGREVRNMTTVRFKVDEFDPTMLSAEIQDMIKSYDARDLAPGFHEMENSRMREERKRQNELERLPIFRSDYLDSYILQHGKRSNSESEPEDPSIYDFEQPTEDPIEKYGKINLDLVKLFSLEKNDTAREIYLNNSRKMKRLKQLYLKTHSNTTLVDFENFKLPRSGESMEEQMITEDIAPFKTAAFPRLPTNMADMHEFQRERILAEYFTDLSSSSGDSHVNTFEFYDELRAVDYDITKNKKLMDVFMGKKLRNETLRAKIKQKAGVKLEQKRLLQTSTIKKTTKSRLDELLKDIERIPTGVRTFSLEVTKKKTQNYEKKTASEELREELEKINLNKPKGPQKKRKLKSPVNATAKKTRRTKSKIRASTMSITRTEAMTTMKAYLHHLNKYTLPEMHLKPTSHPIDLEAPPSYEVETLKHYDLKKFGIDEFHEENIGVGNKLHAQSRIVYKDELSEETKKQMREEDEQRRYGEKRRKRRNVDYNGHLQNGNATARAKVRCSHHWNHENGTRTSVNYMDLEYLRNFSIQMMEFEKGSITPTWHTIQTLNDYDLKDFGMGSNETQDRRNEQSRLMYESELSEETKAQIRADEKRQEEEVEKLRKEGRVKRFAQSYKYSEGPNSPEENDKYKDDTKLNSRKFYRKEDRNLNVINKRRRRQIGTDEDILKKYTKRIDNVVLQKRFREVKKQKADLGLVDEKVLKVAGESESVKVEMAESNSDVLRNLMGLEVDESGNNTHLVDTDNNLRASKNKINKAISRSFELEVENVPITTRRRTVLSEQGTERRIKRRLSHEMEYLAKQQWNPAALVGDQGSYESEQTDKSFYNYFGEVLKTTAFLSEEISSQANDSVIEAFIQRKEEATRRYNLMRDLIVTRVTLPTNVTYKTRRTFNRRALVNCTGHVIDHRWNLLIPAKLKRMEKRVYVTEYPRYNMLWYYTMWPNFRKLVDKYISPLSNITGRSHRRKTKYPQTKRTIYITKKTTTRVLDRILQNLYNSTKYACTKYYKPAFNPAIDFNPRPSEVVRIGKMKNNTRTVSGGGCNNPNGCGCAGDDNETTRKTRRPRNPNARRPLHYVRTKLEVLENNDLIDNRNWGMVVFASNFTRSIVLRKLIKTTPTTEWHVSNVPVPKNLDFRKQKQQRLYDRHYAMSTLTPLPWVEDNIRRVREMEAKRAQEEIDYKGEPDVNAYADYLGIDPNDIFQGQTPPFPVEPLTVPLEYDLFDNTTDFTYSEYEVPTDPTFTFDPVYHDNVEELNVMRKATRTTFDPTAMNVWNFKKFFTRTSTRKKDRTTTEFYIWTERTFRVKFENMGPTEHVPVYTCHQCPARFLNNEDTNGENLLMRHFLKHQNLYELYYPIGWRFEKQNRSRWYNSRVRKYFMRLLKEQDIGLSGMVQ